MSKGKWILDPLTGLPLQRQRMSIEETYLNDDGTFNPASLPDCDLFAQNSIAAAAGFKDVPYLLTLVAANPELFHTHQIPDEDGKTVTRATATNSAQAGGWNLRAKAAEAHRAAAALPRKHKIDPSSGSNT